MFERGRRKTKQKRGAGFILFPFFIFKNLSFRQILKKKKKKFLKVLTIKDTNVSWFHQFHY